MGSIGAGYEVALAFHPCAPGSFPGRSTSALVGNAVHRRNCTSHLRLAPTSGLKSCAVVPLQRRMIQKDTAAVAKVRIIKHKLGRPPIDGVPGKRYQVHLPIKVAEWIRAQGSGSLSQGISQLAKGKMLEKKTPTR